mgnify:CR=1 FL=1
MAIDEVVLRELHAHDAPHDAIALWPELWAAFEDGGPDAVKTLLQKMVREAKRRAEEEVHGMKSAAAAAQPKPKTRRKRTVGRGR